MNRTYRYVLPRRAVLRGLGVSLGLPLLDAMMPGCTREPESARDPLERTSPDAAVRPTPEPRRLLYFYVPNGFNPHEWTPASTGPGYDLPRQLAPLAAVRDRVSVISGVNNPLYDTSAFHSASTVGLLTCRGIVKHRIWASQSADQVAASLLGNRVPFRSIEVGTTDASDHLATCDGEWPCLYGDHLSWAGPTQPMPKETSPARLFRRLFAAPGDEVTFTRAQSQRRSILDFVRGEASSLRGSLGGADRSRVDEYLNAVREAERQVQAIATVAPGTVALPDEDNLQARLDAFIDIIALAFRADLTRVATIMHGFALYPATLDFIPGGRIGPHHAISHHGGDPAQLERMSVIGQWEVQRFVRLVERLSVAEADGTVLGRSAVLFMSDLFDGDDHRPLNLPLLLAGTGGGVLRTGQHIRVANTLLPDLHITLLRTLGIDLEAFGDLGRGVIRPLLA